MQSTEHLIKIERTARYRTLGELTPKTKTIWFALHGYGQLAKFFIRKFKDITDEETLIVAPEGISRFYLDEKYDRIGASWITREEKESEAEEYINFLNSIYDKITQNVDIQNVTINILGFSQGCATALRWLNADHISCNKLVLWAGFFANGIADMIDPKKLESVDIYYVYGKQDEFLVQYPEISAVFRVQMQTDINPTVIPFEGTHRVDEIVLKKLIKSWK